MASPSVSGTIAKGGTATVANSLPLTTTAVAAVGDLVLLIVGRGASGTFTATDSKGNTYAVSGGVHNASLGGYTALYSYLTTALAISDTITIACTGTIEIAGLAVRITGASPSMGIGERGAGTNLTGTSTAPLPGSLTLAFSDDVLYYSACALVGNFPADFSSIGSSYTILDSASSTSGANDVSVAVAFRAVSAATPMVATQPTWTLANSRVWKTAVAALSGITDRGAVAKDIALTPLTSPVQQLAQGYSQDEIEALSGGGDTLEQGGGISVITRPA